ncbi:hypothetical protein [Agrobacterium tumefaciens]|uniref:hypothetical protein n=1 Tax=Agrobacterium tumefaciens TaxID=358 RepID=UPI0021D2509D|nr:hypothetical protein [Agrobacterium tumefaciens]UXS01112.1 hypothetical protein FY156_06205 [Agrobacterium tumefaciens]
MIIWKDEGNRLLARCGDTAVGAVFRPLSAKYFRYRVWVGPTKNAANGSESTVEKAQKVVEHRFDEFLAATRLQPVPVPPDDMPLIEILAKASSAERRDWLLKCPLALLLRVQHQAKEVFTAHGEEWGVDYIAAHVAHLHMTRGAGAT